MLYEHKMSQTTPILLQEKSKLYHKDLIAQFDSHR